jgi:hypothetical protein
MKENGGLEELSYLIFLEHRMSVENLQEMTLERISSG